MAGPMTAPDGWLWEQNINRAAEMYFELVALGAAPISPQLQGRVFKDTFDHATWMDVDFSILNGCIAMVTIPGWENSKGSQMEVEFAKNNNIPVLSLPPLPWNKPVREQIQNFIVDLRPVDVLKGFSSGKLFNA